jgi:hypothetical protein
MSAEPEANQSDPITEAPEADSPNVAPSAGPVTVAPTGKRQAFRDIRRQLQDADMTNPAILKLLLDDLDRSEMECAVLEGYVDRFHHADKRAAVLEEKVRTNTAIEIFFAVGLGVGCAIIGLVPSFWDHTSKGPLALVVGFVLLVGSAIGRMVKQ